MKMLGEFSMMRQKPSIWPVAFTGFDFKNILPVPDARNQTVRQLLRAPFSAFLPLKPQEIWGRCWVSGCSALSWSVWWSKPPLESSTRDEPEVGAHMQISSLSAPFAQGSDKGSLSVLEVFFPFFECFLNETQCLVRSRAEKGALSVFAVVNCATWSIWGPEARKCRSRRLWASCGESSKERGGGEGGGNWCILDTTNTRTLMSPHLSFISRWASLCVWTNESCSKDRLGLLSQKYAWKKKTRFYLKKTTKKLQWSNNSHLNQPSSFSIGVIF